MRIFSPQGLHFFSTVIVLFSRLVCAAEPRDPAKLATELCAGCHGPNLAGGIAPSLLDDIWKTGSDDENILAAIHVGNSEANMPPFPTVLSEEEQRGLLGYIRRLGLQFALGQLSPTQPIPNSVTPQSEKHTLKLETFAAP